MSEAAAPLTCHPLSCTYGALAMDKRPPYGTAPEYLTQSTDAA